MSSLLKKQPVITFVGQQLAQSMDKQLFNKYKLGLEIAMELAGQSVAYATHDFLTQKLKQSDAHPGRILVLAGPGSELKRQRRGCHRGRSAPQLSFPP